MARTSAPVVLLEANVLAASSGSKGSPNVLFTTPNGFYDNQLNYNSPLGIYIRNGLIGPGTPVSVVVQVRATDTAPWTDYETVSGDAAGYVASPLAGVTSKTIELTKVRFVRVIAFGNTSQDVFVSAHLHAVTGL